MFQGATEMGMKSKAKSMALLLAASLSVSACQGENEGVGTLIGAGLGAFIGHEIGGHGDGAVIGTMLGTAVGASIGSSVGRKLDRADRMAAAQARSAALESYESGDRSVWYNPDSGNQGAYTARPAYRTRSGQYCREYTQEITVGGQTETGYGTACRQPDGSWKIING